MHVIDLIVTFFHVYITFKNPLQKINTENPQHFYSSSFLFYLDVAIENIYFIIIYYYYLVI